MSKHNEDVQIRASLETLSRHVSENWRQQLRALQATIDRQVASLEASFDEAGHAPLVDAALQTVSQAAAGRAERARQQAEATAAQAVAAIEVELRSRLGSEASANAALRASLEEAKKEIESAKNRAVRAEAAQRATTAQHNQALEEHTKLTTALDHAQAQLLDLQARLKSAQREHESSGAALAAATQQVQELSAERDGLLQRIDTVSGAKTALEAQYRQLEGVTQKLSSALSQMLRERDPAAPQSADAVKTAAAKPPAPKSAAPAPPAAPAPAAKKPLQFAQRARDARRVKIRRGIDVSVDGIPGELVDLSVGGAQAILRQAVKPNQLVRMVLLTAAGQVICKGRVVWVVFEQPDTSLSVYRTGVKFADVDAAAVESFMNDFCEKMPIKSRNSSGVA